MNYVSDPISKERGILRSPKVKIIPRIPFIKSMISKPYAYFRKNTATIATMSSAAIVFAVLPILSPPTQVQNCVFLNRYVIYCIWNYLFQIV